MAQKQDNMMGLFGTTPQSYMQERQRQDEVEQLLAGRMAANPGTMMSPSLAPLYSQAAQQGQLIGRGIEGLFGVQDPGLARAAQIQQATQAIQGMDLDMSDPKQVYPAMIQELQKRGLIDVALPLLKEYQGVLNQEAEMKYKQAAARQWDDDKFKYFQDYLGRITVIDKATGRVVRSDRDYGENAPGAAKPTPNAPQQPGGNDKKPAPKDRPPITNAYEK